MDQQESGMAADEYSNGVKLEGLTPYHAKYYAWELTSRRRGGELDRISSSLFDASVDLNPHQIDAALFALQNPPAKGVPLADEVGLGNDELAKHHVLFMSDGPDYMTQLMQIIRM